MIWLTVLYLWSSIALSEGSLVKFSNGAKLQVEVAESFTARNKGLMGRQSLDENSGMLFIFDQPKRLSFWMKDTYIPLSIGYFDENRFLKEVHHMKPQSLMEREQDLRSYGSECLCKYAIEVNKGWFSKNKVKVGMGFELIRPKKDPDQ